MFCCSHYNHYDPEHTVTFKGDSNFMSNSFWLCTIISWFISKILLFTFVLDENNVISSSDVKKIVHQMLKHQGNHRHTNPRVEVRISGFFEMYNFYSVLWCILRLFCTPCTMNVFHIYTMKSCKIWSDMIIDFRIDFW